MSARLRIRLAIAVAMMVGVGLFVMLGRGEPGPRPSRPEASAAAADHPLEPLHRDEMDLAVRLLRESGKVAEAMHFALLALHEPPKEEVLRFRAGTPFRREAFAVVLDGKHNRTYEAVVDLRGKKVLSWQHRPGVQPAVWQEELDHAEKLVRQDRRWRAALRRRAIEDPDRVYLEGWAPGPLAMPGNEGARLVRMLSYYQGDAVAPYGRPIEGVIAVVNLTADKVIEVQDSEPVKLPAASSDCLAPATIGPLRQAPRPLVLTQPKGPSFQMHGHEVRWQKWRFRYALHPRDGLVLYTVAYEDGDRLRSLLYRASLAEMLVPYGDPAPEWSWRSPFDEGEYTLGRLTMPLRRGQEVPEYALLTDGVFLSAQGAPYTWPRAVALYEQDGDILWTHAELSQKQAQTRRSRQLVLRCLATVGNYDYVFSWIFAQDGTLELRIDMSGIVLVRASAAANCAVCRQQPDADGKIQPRGADRFGTLVDRNRIAINHQHLFCCRLDLDVDGAGNSVRELNVRALPVGKDNPLGNAFLCEQTLLRTEKEARRDLDMTSQRRWKVLNPNRRTALGHFPGYVLEPGTNTVPHGAAESSWRRRAGFVNHHVWVTRQRASEMYAAGDYPNQHSGGDGVAKWASDDESIANQDIVLWYTFGVTHTPHAEEWPVMPAVHTGFRLVPNGFFTRNPALDVPAEK